MDPENYARTRDLEARPATRKDSVAIIKLQQRARPLFLPWTHGQLESHLRLFPEGQLVATQHGAIVGACASLKLRLPDDELPASWAQATGHGYFHSHDPAGDLLYVAGLAIDPAACRFVVRRKLDDALLRLALAERVTRVLLPLRLPAFVPLAPQMPPETYLERLREGQVSDPVYDGLRVLGFRAVALLSDHQDRPRSGDHLAALLEWRSSAA